MPTSSLKLAVCLCFLRLFAAGAAGESAALSGRIVDDAGQPVPAAQVTIDIIYRPHSWLGRFDEWKHRWSLTSDAQGRYAHEMPLLDPIERMWLNVSVSAEGLVDRIQSSSSEGPHLRLKTLLSPDQRTVHIEDLRLLRGVKVRGRVLGGDGKPVIEARLFALGATAQGAKEPGASGGQCWHRPRRSGREGRFEFFAHPRMGIDLMIQSDRWAPKRILIPAGQEDAGDIHLERGTVVTGTLTSEDGAPLPGYWVLAEGLDGGMFANSWNPLRCPAKTDAAGRFSLPPLKGRFKILAPDSVQVWLGEPRLRTPSPTLAILPQDYAFDGMGGPVEVHLRAAQQVHVSGRLLTLDGQPAKREVVAIYCNVKDPQRQIELDVALANGEGHFAFQGIPRGVKEVVISGMGVRPWKPEQQLFLGMYPLPHVSGARTDGQVYLDELRSDITNIDFQFRPWKAGKGFVSQVPEEAARLPTKNAEPRESAAKAPAPAGTSLTPDEKLDWLEMEYERTLKEFIERERAARGQVQTMRPTNTPPAEYASKFLALAEAHPRTEAAFRALSWICRTASTGALSLTGGAAVSPLPTALARLQRDHLTSTNFSGALLEQIAAFLEPEADPLLQTLAETSPHREVRGQACYYLAKRLARANEKKPSTDGKQQAVRLFQRVTNDFPDLSLGRRTLGEAATRDLNEIEQLAVGKLAPEIIGVDAGGVEFKLSDHTGRIVVLMFSGEWCTPCRAQQPRLRALQAKFRDKPVRLLGVMSDPPERLREAIRKGDITWPCWCDRDWTGPITSQWNITTWPTIHVLDRRGVIRYRNASPDQLEAVLERLLQEQL